MGITHLVLQQTNNVAGYKTAPNRPTQTPFNGYNGNTASSNDLFAPNEIAPMVGEVFNRLQKCKSKQDVITAIFEVVSKFCFSR